MTLITESSLALVARSEESTFFRYTNQKCILFSAIHLRPYFSSAITKITGVLSRKIKIIGLANRYQRNIRALP